MSDWKKRNEDWRDEDELEEEEECECPWVDSKGKVRETAYCQYLLEKHPMMCLKQKLFDQNGEVDEDALLYEVHSDLRDFVLDNLAKKEKQVLDALRIETYTPEWKPQLDRIHLQNGTYFLDERGFVPEKELCLNRLPVEYQPDAPAPTKWLEFLDGLLIPEDILTLQEYLGYLLIPSTKAQKMLVMTGKGGEGKSRIGLLLKKLFGEASHSESILRIETNRFASANLEYKLVMVDDDLNMVALPETRNIKSIVTAEDRLCIERKNKQAVQGLLYVRFICFGNGNLVAAHDDSDGFWRRQILITVKDRDPARVDNPFLIEELSEERPGILLWMLEGLHRLLANRYQFTISERSIQNLEAAMADSDNLTQFMQATAYVRFKPDTEERSTYLYRAYTKWCEDNLESPVPQKKFSQFLLKNAGKYGLTFSKHIFGLLLRVRSGRPLHIYRPTGCSSTGTAPGLEKCKGDMPMTNVRKNSAKLTREDLKIAPESPTMKRQELAVPCEFSVRNSMVISDETSDQTPAVEPSNQTSKTVRHAPLVYRVEEIAQLLAISNRAAYNLCNTTKDFKVIRLGTSIRVSKQSFDDWFAAV